MFSPPEKRTRALRYIAVCGMSLSKWPFADSMLSWIDSGWIWRRGVFVDGEWCVVVCVVRVAGVPVRVRGVI